MTWPRLTYVKQNLTLIPREILNCNVLKELNLSHNKISILSPRIGECVSIVKLHLNGNRIKYLPQEVSFSRQIFGIISICFSVKMF